jgi:hypothetical protein
MFVTIPCLVVIYLAVGFILNRAIDHLIDPTKKSFYVSNNDFDCGCMIILWPIFYVIFPVIFGFVSILDTGLTALGKLARRV